MGVLARVLLGRLLRVVIRTTHGRVLATPKPHDARRMRPACSTTTWTRRSDLLRPRRRPEDRYSRETTGQSVELRGFEPLTYSMRTSRATNCAIAPGR
jgi:hypothetical protein